MLAASNQLSLRLKVYASGGENTLHAHVNDHDCAVRGLLRIQIDPATGLIINRTDYWDSKVFLTQAGLE